MQGHHLRSGVDTANSCIGYQSGMIRRSTGCWRRVKLKVTTRNRGRDVWSRWKLPSSNAERTTRTKKSIVLIYEQDLWAGDELSNSCIGNPSGTIGMTTSCWRRVKGKSRDVVVISGQDINFVKCESPDNSQQVAYESFLINLCASPKLITWNSTSTLQPEVSEKALIKSSACVLLPAKRKCPVRRQRLPKILISNQDSNLDMAPATKVDPKPSLLNPTASFIPLTEDQSQNYHIFNELLAEHEISNVSRLAPELPSITPNPSRGTKRSVSNSQLFTASSPTSKKSKPTLHWTEILDDLMTASDWEEAEEEAQKEADQNKKTVDATSLKQTVSFIPLTEDQSENFHIFNELLAEYNVSTSPNHSLSTSKTTSINTNLSQRTKRSPSHSQFVTTRAPISRKSKPTLHWTEILDNFMTVSDWEEAEEELMQESNQSKSIVTFNKSKEPTLDLETCASVPQEFTPLTFVESSNFDIFNELVLEHQLLETLKSSSSECTTATSSPPPRNQNSSSISTPSKPSLQSFKDSQRQLHWSEVLDSLMTDEDREEADESFTISVKSDLKKPITCPETPLESFIPSSYSSAENTHALPTPIEELKDPFELISNDYQNSYYQSDMSFDLVKSSLKESDYLSMEFSSFNFENSFCS
ncbi:uncharacterized protein MELLADRAFT_111062 [Melampsora larici-populina 98AG31]|uniref:Uncharacterized protein n=1 Tax=Melampsora larici-populina (strain 98AG31 / pathotype 3-4-7) TaxID=747676 RepID=F4S1X4_MELLP|nr:uncharacterized protein MELLADRAFT_111062 [Melampsora larici-populina 98AG31]EGG01268.1 hypothetical protein MELLADRAFT_111062 [Melampsora larici-populina 98AG31]